MTMSHQQLGETADTVGIDAIPPDAFDATDTYEGEMIVYDRENEDGWIQSDLYYPRNQIV